MRQFFIVFVAILTCGASNVASADSLLPWAEPRKVATPALEAKGFDTSMDNLLTLVNDPSQATEIRALSLVAIGESGDPSAISVLETSLVDDDETLRLAAVRGLGSSRTPRAAKSLGDILVGDDDPMMKMLALSGLATMPGDVSQDAIVTAANHEQQDRNLRIALVAQLRKVHTDPATQTLVNLAHDADPEIRARVAIALSERESMDAEDILVRSVNDDQIPHYLWRETVMQLQKLAGQDFAGSINLSNPNDYESAKMSVRQNIDKWLSEKSPASKD